MNDSFLQRLLSLRKTTDVSSLLATFSLDKYDWKPVGDDVTNFREISHSRSGVRAIMERITNAIDAILEAKKELRKNSADHTIKSPREALESWFGAKGGHISSLSNAQRRELAEKSIHVVFEDSGVEKRPTIIVKDYGIGLHPSEFKDTIVGLGKSRKRGKPYLLGAYGWGGSQTLTWCNGVLEQRDQQTIPLAVIVSRKNPELLNPDESDLVSWTIVRYKEMPEEKYGVFEYLVMKNGQIPTMDPKNLPQDFLHGTQVTHFAYNLEKYYGPMTLVGYRLFQSFLFDPVIPFSLTDNRGKKPETRTISGNLSRLETDDEHLTEYSNTLIREGDFGQLKIRYWVFKMKEDGGYHIDSYLEKGSAPESILITLNGQRQGSLTRQILKDYGFSFLSEYMLIHIDCDGLTFSMKKNVFPTTREDVRDEYRSWIKEEIATILQEDEELKRLEQLRRQQHSTTKDEDSLKRVRKFLDKLIASNKKISSGKKGAEKGKNEEEYVGQEPPTTLKIISKAEPIQIVPGIEKRILIKTDAADDILIRSENNALRINCHHEHVKCTVRTNLLSKGRIYAYLFADSKCAIGDLFNLEVSLDFKGGSISDKRALCVVPIPPPLPSNEPPTIFEIINEETPLQIYRGKRSLVHIKCDGHDGLFERSENRATLDVSFLPEVGATLIGRTDLKRHKMKLFLRAKDDSEINLKSEIVCKMVLGDKQIVARRPCIILEEPPSADEGEEFQLDVPNYDLVEVEPGDKNWTEFKWDDSDVGSFGKSGDVLMLYVSLGNKHYFGKRDERKVTPDQLKRFKEKYVSYVAFHLWLLHQESQKGAADTQTQTPEQIKAELKRTVQTVLLSMQPETSF